MMLSRVVWSEGMHLAQHHFQMQCRYFEDLIAFTVSNVTVGGYGVSRVEIDAEAMLNGTVTLAHARGVMPDGTVFTFPDDPPPEPLAVRELFSPARASHDILLALPVYRPDRANCRLDSMNGGGDPRFRADTALVPDETTGQGERSVGIARKNFRLLLDSAPREGLVTLAVARVRRDGSGQFVHDPEFIPPSLEIGASHRLVELVARLVEMLEARADALSVERRGHDAAEYASREIAGFWLTHTIHGALGPLRHLLQSRSGHPEQLYREMARLAGALCTFSIDGDVRALPLYDHDRPDACFQSLDRHIRQHLEVMLPTNSIAVPLTVMEPGFFRGFVPDARGLGRAHWFLGVRSSNARSALVADVPRLVKVCSAAHIAKLVQRAYPGVELHHVPVPPSEISPRLGMEYFRLETNPPANSASEPCWKLIADTSEIGVYLPAAIGDAELALSIVTEP
jgi:type VI secretion system protein ImpJ